MSTGQAIALAILTIIVAAIVLIPWVSLISLNGIETELRNIRWELERRNEK